MSGDLEAKALIKQKADWLKVVKNGKAKRNELKEYLKAVKLPQTGDVVDMGKRVLLHVDVVQYDLYVTLHDKGDAKVSPFKLNPSQLMKALADRGLSPVGDKDELISRLVNNLRDMKKEEKSGGEGAAGTTTGTAGAADGEDEGITLAKKVLKIDDDNYCAILSLLGDKITESSSVGAMRKAYLKISLKIHPDKLQSKFGDATKAFQCLVNAYERLSQPELFAEEDSKKKKDKTIMRSNQGCYRTSLYCPRCRSEWGLPVSGVEKHDYNWMMMGLKMYACCTCLFQFGCVTALHKCPHCGKSFEYHPNDFHRKIKCENQRCNKEFGFYVFNVSSRREGELRKELRQQQEKRMRLKEAASRRERRAKERGKDELDASEEEKAYVLGLVLSCPRCGYDEEEDRDGRGAHLKSCKDKKKIAAHKAKLKAEANRKAQAMAAKEKEEDVQGLMAWDFLGGDTGTLWTLTESQLRTMCGQYNLDSTGDREALLRRIAEHRNNLDSSNMLTDGSKVASKKKNKRKIDPSLLPSNLEEFTYEQLRGVCAVHGLEPKSKNKRGIIDEIEKAAYGKEEAFMLMGSEDVNKEGKSSSAGPHKKQKLNGESDGGDEYVADDDDDDDDDVIVLG
eukprot:Nk52_evm10s168 gene=Nk52_evmTU10s168